MCSLLASSAALNPKVGVVICAPRFNGLLDRALMEYQDTKYMVMDNKPVETDLKFQ